MEYIVPGDGKCLVNSAAAHITGDVDEVNSCQEILTHIKVCKGITMLKKIISDFPLLAQIVKCKSLKVGMNILTGWLHLVRPPTYGEVVLIS